MRKSLKVATISVALIAAAAASGEESSPKPEDSNNKMICRTVEETGSRLKAKKICMTAAEWAEQRRLSRMAIEKAQLNACTPGASC